MAGLVPVTIVAGFLGAGKTTLINHLLQADHGLNITVLVNDFGAINIDAELILKRQRDVMELSNGCVCCSIQGDLVAQLQKMFQSENPPDYLLIEASGVSQPSRIAAVFGYPQLRGHARLDAVVTLLDAANANTLEQVGRELVQDQVEAADIIVLTKTDLVDDARVNQVSSDWLLPDQPVIKAINGAVSPEVLLDVSRHDPSRGFADTLGKASAFATVSWASSSPKPYAHFKTVLRALPVSYYRAKGVLYCADYPEQRIVFQKVGPRIEFQQAGDWPDVPGSRVVGIGEVGAVSEAGFHALLEGALEQP